MGMGQTPANVAARALFLYENYEKAGNLPSGGRELDQRDVAGRALLLVVSYAKHGLAGQRVLNQNDITARSLFLHVAYAHGQTPADVAGRALHPHVAYTNGELFPWIEKIAPTEALPGQQLAIYGDGFGDTQAQEDSIVRLGSPVDPTVPGPGLALGVVSWSSRSPNLHPANSGVATEPAIIATVPDEAESGSITVEQTT